MYVYSILIFFHLFRLNIASPLHNTINRLSEVSIRITETVRYFGSLSTAPQQHPIYVQPELDDPQLLWNVGNLPQHDVVCGAGTGQEMTSTRYEVSNVMTTALNKLHEVPHQYNYPKVFSNHSGFDFPQCNTGSLLEHYIGPGSSDGNPKAYRIVFQYPAAGMDAKYCGLIYHQGAAPNGPFAQCV